MPTAADKDPIATSLAADIPPLECDHRAALELLYQQDIRQMGDGDLEALVRMYREQRRQDAAKRLVRDRARADKAAKKVEAAARKALKTKGGGEGDPDATATTEKGAE